MAEAFTLDDWISFGIDDIANFGLSKDKLQKHAKAFMEKVDNVPVRIAVCGESGSGKSTLINTLRGLRPSEKGAAAVGIEETTTTPTHYPWPRHENVVLVDLPGCNTKRFKVEAYVKDVRLAEYDAVLVVFAGRVHDSDLAIAEQLAKLKKPFWFVRSKFDQDVKNMAQDQDSVDEDLLTGPLVAQAREKIEGKLKGDMRLVGLEERPLFFVCGKIGATDDYDMPELIQRVSEELPDALKRTAFILCVHTESKKLIGLKLNALRRLIPWYVLASSTVALAPIPGLSAGVDLMMVLKFAHQAANAFGITKERLAEAHGAKYIVLAYKILTSDAIAAFLKRSSAYIASSVTEECARLLPVVGSIIASILSGATMYLSLAYILKDIAKAAEDAQQKIIQDIAK